ncbi:MAG: TauD/TfdA family dioxygenase [Novosphingobium sp.]|nr:TauD/TfdA family dioxygenase [Novosphingobium sp.]
MRITPVHPMFGAEISGIDVAAPLDAVTLEALRGALDGYGVVVIPDQERLDDDAQIAFCQNFGTLQTSITLHRKDAPRRMTRDELTELSNIDGAGQRIASDDTKRKLQLPGRLWHSDNSFRSPPGLFTFLHARVVPPKGGDTEFADMRAAYDELDEATRDRLCGLQVIHSLARSRELVGAPPLSPEERVNLPDTIQPLVRGHPASGRKSLYLSSHARDVVGMDEREGRALLAELTDHATQARFVYSHKWSAGDMVIWDNRCTMHRATPFPEDRYRRDMRRTSVADTEAAVAA